MADDILLTVREAAALVGCDRRTIQRLIIAGELAATPTVYGWRIAPADLERMPKRPVGWPKDRPRTKAAAD